MNPTIDWASALPLIVVLGAGVLGTLVESFVPRGARRATQVVLSLLAIAVALVSVVWRATVVEGFVPIAALATPNGTVTGVNLVEDGIALIAQAVILVSALLAFLVIADRTELRDGAFAASAATRPGSADERESTTAKREQTEIFPLALFATGGMMAFTSAFDLLTLFIALEVLSLPLYVLSATARRRRLLSQEAALKYFVLGAFSSAMFLMGAALVYGATGSVFYMDLFNVNGFDFVSSLSGGDPSGAQPLLLLGVALVSLGLLFKVGAVPFHAWTPDVYQGAPTPITGFMAAGTKAAAFVALARFLLYVGGVSGAQLNVFMWIVIILTIVVGTVLGLVQTDIKRLLAYSSIAHAGFILIAINALHLFDLSGEDFSQAMGSILFYLLTYGLATVGAFGVVTLVRERDAAGNVLGEATRLSAWAGLGKRSPLAAAAMLIFLLSFAGIPLTGGFIGKFEVFRAGVAGGETVLVVIAVLASAATAFFYFRLVQLMFFKDPEGDETVVVESEGLSVVAVAVAAVLIIVLGVIPGPVLDMIQSVMNSDPLSGVIQQIEGLIG